MIAALLTRMSTPPWASTAEATIATADSAERTSTSAPVTAWPFAARASAAEVAVGDDDGGASLGERFGVDDTDASGAPGDHRDLAGQVEEVCCSHGLTRP